MEAFHKLYQKANPDLWQGRIDGEDRALHRWHQVVECVDLNSVKQMDNAIAILGFCSDEGVRRNKGREGAKAAPPYLRKILANLPVHFGTHRRLIDVGDIHIQGYDLESAQKALAMAVSKIRSLNGFPLIIGGGHEVTYGHFRGLSSDNKRIGVINIDAHLDMRPLEEGKGNSGTSFYQLERELSSNGQQLHYMAIGIQDIANTQGLLQYAISKDVLIVKADEIQAKRLDAVKAKIESFAAEIDELYLTLDMDVFAAAYAPGVSAVAFQGLIPDHTFYELLTYIFKQPKLVSMDIAELNPRFDIDEHTGRLAASFIFKLLQEI